VFNQARFIWRRPMGFLDDLFEGGHRRQGRGRWSDDDDDHGHDHGHDDRQWPAGAPQTDTGRVQGPAALCPKCSVPVGMMPGFRFCPYCGAGLNIEPTCRGCGAKMVNGAAFCHACGARS
jgi:hypothetical protein